jgi:TRAP-type C4-dicarboxylate transport system permease small subunit
VVVSVVGRAAFGRPILGDVELVQFGIALAISLGLPWCQLRRGNIIVDFFTARASQRTRSRLDRIGALLLALVMALMSWRATIGGLNAWQSQSGSMMLGFPEWIVYSCIMPAFVLTALIALVQGLRGFDDAGAA